MACEHVLFLAARCGLTRVQLRNRSRGWKKEGWTKASTLNHRWRDRRPCASCTEACRCTYLTSSPGPKTLPIFLRVWLGCTVLTLARSSAPSSCIERSKATIPSALPGSLCRC
eukprot:1358812-Rhodomonas_salina.1